MTRGRVLVTGLALLVTAGVLRAQVTSKTETVKGAAQVTTEQLTGEVVAVEGNVLLVKMLPRGYYSVFDVKPGREFVIDGQTKHIGDLKPGTVLTATVTTTTESVTTRTINSLTGKVQWVQGSYVILALPNGEHREYNVPASFKFVVEGKPTSVADLKQGMNVAATKIVEEPRTELSEKTVITGKSPK